MNSNENKKALQEQGYFVLRGLLDVQNDILPLKTAYSQLIDTLAYIYMLEANPSALDTYDNLPLPERVATLLGSSGGRALHHLDPVLNLFAPNFQWRPDLPTAHIPELFYMIRHAKLLDVLEGLIGPEIFATPLHHINFRLAQSHLEFSERLAETVKQDNPAHGMFYDFHVGHSHWHTDLSVGLPDAQESEIVNAWVPLTEVTTENSCLVVIPGSHKLGLPAGPLPSEVTDQGVALEVSPGDVIFLDHKLIHSSSKNTTTNDFRWAFNFRYLPTGQPTGRPFLPGFIARSRSAPAAELRNPFTWSTMWNRALNHIAHTPPPLSCIGLGPKKIDSGHARLITQKWSRLAPDEHGWLKLGARHTRSRRGSFSRFLKKGIRRLRQALPNKLQ